MRIAVVGWGSLIWYPGSLYLASRWYRSGPQLPVEFSRVSKDRRLTLVITPGADRVPTLWALSAFPDVASAADNLQNREGTIKGNISQVCISRSSPENGSETTRIIYAWLIDHSLDAAVWTALSPKSPAGDESPMGAQRAIAYIGSLAVAERPRAEEYVRNAPEQIETVIRKSLRQEFNWQNNPLSRTLFEDDE